LVNRKSSKALLIVLIIVVVCGIAAAYYYFFLEGGIMTIKNGSKVSINYTLKVDGNVVDTSEGREPLTYVHGSGQIIPGLEVEITGMKKGDKKNVEVIPEKGYGQRDPQAVQKVPRTAFNEPEKLQVGGIITGEANGQAFQAMIVGLTDEEVTLDMNHPLAGKTLNFDIEVVEVE
jgi:FKBP-type peptidyl-prolyl cis-trans isomerase SlyD